MRNSSVIASFVRSSRTCYKIPSTLMNPNPEIVDNFMKAKGYYNINDSEGRKFK